MSRILLILALLVGLSSSVFADVKNGETYRCGSQGNVDFYVGETQFHDTLVSANQNGGPPSPMVSGTHGATERSTSEAPPMTIPNGPTVRVHNGKAQYLNSEGEWIDCGRPRKKPKRVGFLGVEMYVAVSPGETTPFAGTFYYVASPGDDVTSLPLQAGDVIPFEGFYPGEEVTTLPVTASGGPEATSPGEEGSSLPLVRL